MTDIKTNNTVVCHEMALSHTMAHPFDPAEPESTQEFDEFDGAEFDGAAEAVGSKEAAMATATVRHSSSTRGTSPAPRVPAALRQRVEALLEENYAYMDSPQFKNRSIEKELFGEGSEPALPVTSWYQPTREDVLGENTQTP